MSTPPKAPLCMNLKAGRVTPCAPRKTCFMAIPGAHGVTRPAFRFMGREKNVWRMLRFKLKHSCTMCALGPSNEERARSHRYEK